jgi:hypothetical protein
MGLLQLPRITVSGSPSEMGLAYGTACGAQVREFVEQRQRAAKIYLRERGVRDSSRILDLGTRCLELLRTWDPPGWIEHQATAEGARVDAAELYAAANYTDIRDIVTYPEHDLERHQVARQAPDAEGCTAMLFPARAHHGVVAAQTWDLNPSDLEFVVALERRPSQGLATWSITCVGCPSLIGMNASGLAVGTTNIKIRGAHIGIPYLSLLHCALQAPSREHARGAIEHAPRAAAHTYWFADAAGGEDLECSAQGCVRRDGSQGLARTNHCLVAEHQRLEGEPATSSSQSRLRRASAAVAANPSIPEIKALLGDRSDGVDSINRYPEDQQGTSTNACIIAVPGDRELQVCRGAADRGQWERLGFTTEA